MASMKIMLESNPLKSVMLIGRLAVATYDLIYIYIYIHIYMYMCIYIYTYI